MSSKKKYTKQKKDRSKDYVWWKPGRNVIVSGLLIGFSFPFIDIIPTSPLAWIGFVPLLFELAKSPEQFQAICLVCIFNNGYFNAISACWLLVATIPGASYTLVSACTSKCYPHFDFIPNPAQNWLVKITFFLPFYGLHGSGFNSKEYFISMAVDGQHSINNSADDTICRVHWCLGNHALGYDL